ncbi:hypothetical protein BC940DRAFT_334219 [Gongronella butleri]|nr:hypothetical protein BC940DRAFT_334219 [Gongronella butleri]
MLSAFGLFIWESAKVYVREEVTYAPETRLYVGNIARSVRVRALTDLFSRRGSVADVMIMVNTQVTMGVVIVWWTGACLFIFGRVTNDK